MDEKAGLRAQSEGGKEKGTNSCEHILLIYLIYKSVSVYSVLR